MEQIVLNSRVFDKATGRRGKVLGKATYVYEEQQFYVLFDGEKDGEWVVGGRIDLIVE